MDFDNFGPARDLLYVTMLFFGAAAGVLIKIIQKKYTLSQKSNWISVIFLLVSLGVASLAVSVILSMGMVFSVVSVYPFIPFFLALGILGMYFPRAGICSIVFAAGFFTAWICFTFLVFPELKEKEPVKITVRSSNDDYIFRRNDDAWNIKNDGRTITFEAASVTAYPGYPLIGGEQRGLIIRVLRKDEQLIAFTNSLFRFSHSSGFILERYTLDLPPGAMLPGISFSVLFNGKHLYFDPPIQLL